MFGDELAILGFPRGCLDTLTHCRCTCDGFAAGPNGQGWIVKTRAGIADGDSGAPAVDENGRVIGLVSMSSSQAHGAIDYLRPINLAYPLIDATTTIPVCCLCTAKGASNSARERVVRSRRTHTRFVIPIRLQILTPRLHPQLARDVKTAAPKEGKEDGPR